MNKAEQSKRAISEAMLRLMKDREYNKITLQNIVDEAGVSRMAFYRNFESKEDVLRYWLKGVTDRFVAESGISYRDNAPRDYFITLFTHLASYREICEALYNAGVSHLLKDEFDRVFLSIHGGEYDDYKSYFHAGGIYNVFLLWLMRGCPETPEELADKLDNIMTR